MRVQENLLIHAMFEKAMVISGTLYANEKLKGRCRKNLTENE